MSKRIKLTSKQVFLFGLIVVAGIVIWQCLPDPLFTDPLSTVLLSKDNKLLGAKIAADEQWRFPYSEEVPAKFKAAIVHYEDKRFDWHPGVDPLALLRSLYLNISQGRIVSGGSTISMQVIRLSRKNPERTLFEKIKEMFLAVLLELHYSKDEIFALYSSYAPYGGNVVGLETAAWRYFGRDPDQLSWAESCTLAVLPNTPGMIHPGRNRSELKQKRDRLLRQLHEDGKISDMELKLAQLEPLPEKPLDLPMFASHLLETLIVKTLDRQSSLKSTIDKQLQIAVTDIVKQHSKKLSLQGIHNAASLVVDNQTFEVLAYVGNSSLSTSHELGYAVDIIRRPRSTGSTLKPLLFATMIQQGVILPKTLVPDLPTQYAGYMPENYDRKYRGAVPAQEALARSLNVPAVRMLKKYGVGRFYDFLQNMGMTTLHRHPDEYGLTLILGGAEGMLWDMTTMYANLSYIAKQNWEYGGNHYKQLKILQGQQIETDRKADIGPAAAWVTLNALLEVTRPGLEGHWLNFSSSRKIAWKTGTSYGLRDGWAIGNSSRYTVGVWVGNASGEGRAGLTGLGTAAPILFDIFNRLEASEWFEQPIDQMKGVEVCKDDGYLANTNCESETQWIPLESHFEEVTPNHQLVHLDETETWRVHSLCESVGAMVHKSWFVLPPGQEYYYRRHNSDYRTLPPHRKDCLAQLSTSEKDRPIELLYPTPGTKIYIPVDLDEQKSNTVFEAVHRDREATLYWHLDDEYLGTTSVFHQQALDIRPGKHYVTIVDGQGNRLARQFEVLGKKETIH